MPDNEPLKITLDDLADEKPAIDPPPTQAETPTSSRVRAQAEEAGRQVAGTVKGTADKLTQKIAESAAEVTSRSADAAREKMGEMIQAQSKATADAIEARLREVDWKQEAQKGAEGGLRWLSRRLDDLAGKVSDLPATGDAAKSDGAPESDK